MVDKKEKKPGETKEGGMKLPDPLRPQAAIAQVPETGDAVFKKMEAADENLILQEIKGRPDALDVMVYEFEDRGRKVTGLSYLGVIETARTLNARGLGKIRVSPATPPVITETDDHIEITVYGEDLQNGGGFWGTKRQSKYHPNGKANQFFREQALSKAQRNALRGLIPQTFMIEMVKEYKAKGKAMAIGATASPTPPPRPAPAPKVPEAATKDAAPKDDNVISPDQLKLLFVKCREIGLEKEDVKRIVQGKFPDIKSRKDLKTSQLNALIEDMELVKQAKSHFRYMSDGKIVIEHGKGEPQNAEKEVF